MVEFSPKDRLSGVLSSDGGFTQDVRPVDSAGNVIGGAKDELNSTIIPLGPNEEFTGEWVQNNDPQLAFNLLSDTDGTFFLEFSIDGTATLQTLSKSYQIFAGDGQFDALVKMPGRFHRVRFVNSGAAQTNFGIVTATGVGVYPYAISDRDSPKYMSAVAIGVTAEQYLMLVDLDDRANFPHHFTGRINLHSSGLFYSRAANGAGGVQIGVITRVDATDADLILLKGIRFDSASDREGSRDEVLSAPLHCNVEGGALPNAGGSPLLNVAAINTGITLATRYGTATPAVGDMVARFFNGGGSYDGFVQVQYSTS